MRLSEVVRQVIAKAREANEARLQTSRADSPVVASGFVPPLATKREPAAVSRLRELLEAQPARTVYLLTAIMYLGRGDFRADRLADAAADMGETFGGPKLAANQMLWKFPLPEYLEAGLNKLTNAGIDPDKVL
jgi:hypothetical protein